MKLAYHRCEDYYLPNIDIPTEDMRPLGKYGRMRMCYLWEHRALLFNHLLLSGKLMKRLHSIDDRGLTSCNRISFTLLQVP